MRDEKTITLELTRPEAKALQVVIGDISGGTYEVLMRSFLPDPAMISLRILHLLGLQKEPPQHDWVEVTSHGSSDDERHFICAHCPEFKIERAA